jgi:5'/3'-nucleotidase SurE
MGGQGLSVTPQLLDDFFIDKISAQFYVCEAKPADLIYLALGQPERFLQRGVFDLVLTGVNHGENVGMDVFHSGTVGMAMLASTFFETAAIAFSQQGLNFELSSFPKYDLQHKDNIKFICSFLRRGPKNAGLCWNVNFPAGKPHGWKVCSVAHHSRFRPFRPGDRKKEGSDARELERGYIVASPLCLHVAPRRIDLLNTSIDSLHWED